MPTNYLFDPWSLKLPIPAPFDQLPRENAVLSKYTANGQTTSTLHGPTISAMMHYIRLMNGEKPVTKYGSIAALGAKGNDRFLCAELMPESENTPQELRCRCVVIDTTSGSVSGMRVDPITDVPEGYSLGPTHDDGTAILFAMMPLFMEDEEFRDNMNGMIAEYQQSSSFVEIVKSNNIAIARCCDNVFRRLTDSTCTAFINTNVRSNLNKLGKTAIEAGTYAPDTIIAGEFAYLASDKSGNTAKAVIPAGQFCGKYAFSERELTDEEKSLIPVFEPWFVIPQQVVDICEHAQKTTGCYIQMRNFMLRGPAGSGKTEDARATAAGVARPYVNYTCCANTEIFDLIGQLIPITEGENKQPVRGSDVAQSLNLPTYMEISYDSASAYQQLTGIEKDDATPELCYKAVIKRVMKRMAAMSATQQYRYVETPFMQAIRNGYVCELQEPTVILQPVVLVGLNGLLDPDGDIFLPTGEIVHRHPDTIIIVTTNTSYEGCRDINQSVISRMHLLIDVETPDEEIMLQRAVKLSGCEDTDMIKKMVAVVKSIELHCRENSITDGVCGMRELVSWIVSTDKITHDPWASALQTIIPKATADHDSRLELITSCLGQLFSKKSNKKKIA